MLQRRDHDWFDWAFVLGALSLAVIHVYLGVVAPWVDPGEALQFIVVASAFLVGVVVYFSSLWRPILYLVGTVLALYLGLLWLLGGMRYPYVGVVTGVVATAFMLLCTYLFYREETFYSGR